MPTLKKSKPIFVLSLRPKDGRIGVAKNHRRKTATFTTKYGDVKIRGDLQNKTSKTLALYLE